MSNYNEQILLIEDDPVLTRSIKRGLTDLGYKVETANTLSSANDKSAVNLFDLILLDLGLPDGSGFDFLADLRKRHAGPPVIVLTARETVPDKIRGLDLGADDYLVKPFDFQELTARIRVILRRTAGQHNPVLKLGDLFIDLMRREIRRGERIIECTPREFDVLAYLARTPGQAISRQLLTSDVWKVKSRMTSMDNVIDVLMSRLREKVDGDDPVRLLHTVRGLGYMLKVNE
ncbi:MAG TPA: response regulator transcription factor [Kiritimatiellia bacterium]|nr:response regulator transcription factor [Kiritimatiellia bacterium]